MLRFIIIFIIATIAMLIARRIALKTYYNYSEDATRDFIMSGVDAEANNRLKSIATAPYRVRIKYLWFLVSAVLIIVFHNGIVPTLVTYFFCIFVVGDIFIKGPVKKFMLPYQITLNILLFVVYAVRPY